MKYYKVILSNRQEVVLDQPDYDKLLAGMDSGSFVRLKKAIVNPSFIVTILPIPQDQALELPPRHTRGYVDKTRNVFVVTEDQRPVPTGLTDELA